MKIIFYESNPEKLFPVTLARPGFGILSAGTNLYKIFIQQFNHANIDYIIPEYLKKITALKYKPNKTGDNQILFLDSSLVPDFKNAIGLFKKIKGKQNLIIKNKECVIGAYLDLKSLNISQPKLTQTIKSHSMCHPRKSGNPGSTDIAKYFANLKLKPLKINWPCFNHLHELITHNRNSLSSNLGYLKKYYNKYKPSVYLGDNVKISPGSVLDTKNGPIIIGKNTTVSPFVSLKGPLYIGENSLILDFASIENSSIGNNCKIGGEIKRSSMENYSNKQHHGFLGDSYMGEWTNLAAGSTTSNLKNTYGHITMNNIKTTEQFLGCIMADYSKAAINTSIFTGKVIGVNSHVYGQVTADIPSFTNYINSPDQQAEFMLDKAIQIQATMFARRQIRQTKTHIDFLKNVFSLTKPERKQLNIKKCKLYFK